MSLISAMRIQFNSDIRSGIMFIRTFALFLIVISATLAKRSGGYSRGTSHYPSSYGYSGSGSRSTQTHSYPHSTGLSGSSYNQGHASTHQNQGHTSTYTRTDIHHHYHYSPPQHISYGSVNHPVYHHNPPVYVYEYRDSGSRFDSLLTGLALYNLGRMSASHSHYDSHREYRAYPGEICKLGISKSNGEYEETRIDCKLMSSFIWEADGNTNIVSKTNTNMITTVNSTRIVTNTTNSNGTTSQTVTVQNTTVVDALQVKGPSLKVTPGMNCFMIRISRDSSILKRKVECGLLQAYAQNSLRYNGCGQVIPGIIISVIVLMIHIFIV